MSAQNTPSRTPAADTTKHRVATAARRVGEITLDGRLDEQAWRAAQPAGGFVQSYPNATQTNYYAIFTRSVPTTAVGAYTLTIQ